MSTTYEGTRHPYRFGPYLVVVPALAVLWALASQLTGSVPVMIGSTLIGAGWGVLLGFVATRLSRNENRLAMLANGSAFLAIVMAGALVGGSIFDLMLLSASLRSPTALLMQFQPPVFDAPNLFFIIFNTALEALLVPVALFFNWRFPRRRNLMVVGAVLYYLQRLWTYLYFVPRVYQFSTTPVGGPYPAELIERITLWVNLSWFRSVPDALLFLLFLLAALTPVLMHTSPADHRPATSG